MGIHCACDVCNALPPAEANKDEALRAAVAADRFGVPISERMAFIAGWLAAAAAK